MIWAELTVIEKQAAVRQAVEIDGLTYAESANRLGTTRDAIAGVIERARSTNPIHSTSGRKNGSVPSAGGKRTQLAKAARKARARPRSRHQGLQRYVPLGVPDDVLTRAPAREDVWTALPGSAPVPIAEHTSGCRWPINADLPFFYCNEETVGPGVYCARHAAIAYRELPAKERNS